MERPWRPAPDPLLTVALPTSVWKAIYTLLTLELDILKEGSREYREHKAMIALVERQTGLGVKDLPEDLP